MSTKSHIVLNTDIEIFEETSEGIYSWGKFRGWNIYFAASQSCFDSFKMDSDYLYVEFKEGSEAASFFGFNKFKIWLLCLKEIEFNYNELSFVIKGDSVSNGYFRSNELNKFKA